MLATALRPWQPGISPGLAGHKGVGVKHRPVSGGGGLARLTTQQRGTLMLQTFAHANLTAAVALLGSLAAAPVAARNGRAPDDEGIVAAPDRAEADQAADARRKPAV